MKGDLKVGTLRIDKYRGPYIITNLSPKFCTIYPLSGKEWYEGCETFFHNTILQDPCDHILLTPEEWTR